MKSVLRWVFTLLFKLKNLFLRQDVEPDALAQELGRMLENFERR